MATVHRYLRYMRTYDYKYVYVCTYIRMWKGYPCLLEYICMYIHTQAYVRLCTYVFTYVCTYMCKIHCHMHALVVAHSVHMYVQVCTGIHKTMRKSLFE